MIDMTITWSNIEKELRNCSYPDETNGVVVFGAGLLGQSEVPCLRTTLPVLAFCDNDSRKRNTKVLGLPCIYDFFRIPLYLKGLVSAYHFAVRQHWNSFGETILYCYSE